MRSSMRLPGILGGLSLLGVALVGCGPTAASSSIAPHKPVVIALAPLQEPNWFFPVVSATAYTITNLDFVALGYKPLLDITASDRIDYSKSIATHISVTHNDTVFTITLGSRYKWSNGQPVTAQDVVFTWRIMDAASQKGAPWTYGGDGIGGVPVDWRSVVAVNAHTVRITVAKPVNPVWFIRNGIGQLEPVPASVWDKYPGNVNRELRFIASVANDPGANVYRVIDGPYRFQSAQTTNDWIYSANPRYSGHRGTITTLVFKYETSTAAEFSALRTGTVNLGYISNSFWGARHQLTHDVFGITYPFGFSYLALNQNSQAPGGLGPVFRQQYVREAIQMGVNQPGIIKSIYHGNGVQSYGPLASKPVTAFDAPVLAKPAYPFNPAAGRRLLESHGWHLVNGVMRRGTQSLAFTVIYISGSTSLSDTMQLLQSAWAKEGIRVTLKSLPENEVVAIGNQSDPTKWSVSGPFNWTYEPDYYPTGGGLFTTVSPSNSGGYSSKTANALINASYAPGSPAASRASLFRYEEYIRISNPGVFLPWLAGGYVGIGFIIAHSANLHGTVSTYNPVAGLFYPNYWHWGS